MRFSNYGSGKQKIDMVHSETTRQCNSSSGFATWLRRTLGAPRQRGFLLMTPEGKLSYEQRLLVIREE